VIRTDELLTVNLLFEGKNITVLMKQTIFRLYYEKQNVGHRPNRKSVCSLSVTAVTFSLI
jgi:hypothetical protein